jgi:DNA-binding beta-propeller fold protein YncE
LFASDGDHTGALSPVGVPLAYGAGRVPTGSAVDPKGGFAFSADSSGNSVSIFSINSATGSLTYGVIARSGFDLADRQRDVTNIDATGRDLEPLLLPVAS